MLIRDDRKAAKPAVFADRQNIDRVLYDCPDCQRSHFVTVDGCPTAAVAAAETAAVDGKQRAA
jgi:hypothetical protein